MSFLLFKNILIGRHFILKGLERLENSSYRTKYDGNCKKEERFVLELLGLHRIDAQYSTA